MNVVCRYIFKANVNFSWSEEVVVALLVLTYMVGAALCSGDYTPSSRVLIHLKDHAMRRSWRALAELYGKESGFCHGRGGSMHVTKVESGLLGANGIVGGGIPLATGSALADASSEKPGSDSSWQTMLWI